VSEICTRCNRNHGCFGFTFPYIKIGRKVFLCHPCYKKCKEKSCGHNSMIKELLNKLWEYRQT